MTIQPGFQMIATPASAIALFRSGAHDAAIDAAGAVLAATPGSAEALLVQVLARLAKGDLKTATAGIRQLGERVGGEWLVERLRNELFARASISLDRDSTAKLGGLIRARLPQLGPALAAGQRRAGRDYVNVVGTSFVRSFGGNSCFFPLFVGTGPSMLFLTEDAAQVTRRKMVANARRLDLERDMIVSINSDGYYHRHNHLKTRNPSLTEAVTADYLALDAVAERHRPMLAELKALVKGRLFLMAPTPGPDDLVNTFNRHLNIRLEAICAELEIGFLDWWDRLADPATDRLLDRFCTNAYPGDHHFTLETTAHFIDWLKEVGVVGPEQPAVADYDWTHVFECDLMGGGEKTRIWCEPAITPNNAVKSHKIAAAHLGGKLADLLTALALPSGYQSCLYVNVRDGFLPTAMPPSLIGHAVALTDTPANRKVGQIVLDFFGRDDVLLGVGDDATIQRLAGYRPSLTVIACYPDTFDADVGRANRVLAGVRPGGSLMILSPYPDRDAGFGLDGYTPVATFPVGNRYIPEVWRDTTIRLLRAKG